MQKQQDKIVIAIDGHSSCGKSTVAKDIAKRLGLTYIDTGAMYRAVTLFAIENGIMSNGKPDASILESQISSIQIDFRKQQDLSSADAYLNGVNVEKSIRSLEVSNIVSAVSALGFVRRHLVNLQQQMGEKGGIVMDGRDIGTVVFPKADLKIFMTASPEIRAKRRYDEMQSKGDDVSYEDVLANVENRDYVDSTRAESPLRQADDAVLLDNSFLSRNEQLEWVMQKLQEKGMLSREN